ncbi:MAG: hypothetical protein A4E40_00572 [Methanoregulaceae archaeon PtaU1.Bin059]|nr:MAG: hypothetical protein A4E40_00572 [Methanoregulaceae archaeon PtaU1.Bin059]
MVEVLACLKLLLRGARAPDEDTLESLEEVLLGQEDVARPLADLRVEFVDCNLAQPRKTDARLPSLPLLARDRGGGAPDRLDAVAAEEPPVRFAPVEDEEPVHALLLEHLLERLELEVRAAAVHVEVQGLGRLDDGAFEVGPVALQLDGAAEDRHAMGRRVLVVLEPGEDRGDGALDIGAGLLALDVRALAKLVPELGGHVVDLLVRRYVERDELGSAPLLGHEPLECLLELVAPAALVHLLGPGHLLLCGHIKASIRINPQGHKFAHIPRVSVHLPLR